MEIKILQVFYDKNGLPYKDKERTVHYPITSGTFLGASNTTQIRFYYDQLDELNESTFVAVSKLPNGKIGSEILESEYDSELQENYAVLNLSQFYTQYKGDVYISLQGYQGGVRVEQDENGIYQIYGTPTIQATGSIKLSIAYAPTFIGSGQTENVTLQRVLAELSTKLGIRQETLHVEELPTVGNPNVWYVVNDDPNDTTKANIYIWNATTQSYVWVGDNTLNLGDYYTKEQGEQFESGIDNRVSSVENELSSVAQGSPKGVYATLSDLESAYPQGANGIYIVSADGHWYYWNGSAWTDGGVYLSTVDAVPESRTIAGIDLEDDITTQELKDALTNLTLTSCGAAITSQAKWLVSDAYYGGLIDVSKYRGLSVKIVANDTQTSIYTFLTNNSIVDGERPSFAEGYGAPTENVINAGETAIITIPFDANYLYCYMYSVGTIHTPKSINVSLPISGFVPTARTIAGVKLDSDISQDALNDAIKRINGLFVNSGYIGTDGTTINSSSVYSYTDKIEIKPNQKLTVICEGYLTNICIIAQCNSAGTLLGPLNLSKSSNQETYTYSNLGDESSYVVLSKRNTSNKESVYIETINPNDDVSTTLLLNVENGYFNQYGDKTSNNQYRRTTEPLIIKRGQTIKITCYADNGVTSPIVRYNVATKEYLPVVTGAGNSTYSYTTNELEEYIYFCYHNSYAHSYSLETNNVLDKKYLISNIEKNKPIYAPYLFNNVIGIGDSITYGNSQGNYLTNMHKMFGWTVENAGIGGYTALQWWNARKDTYDYTDYDLAIIELGTNGGLTDTIDEDTTSGNYLTYADTNTGRYCSIIENIQNQNPNCKILLVNKYVVDATQETTNVVINKIATKYGLLVINTLELQKYRFDGVIHSLGDNVHFGRYGYYVFTRLIAEQIQNLLDNNAQYFN